VTAETAVRPELSAQVEADGNDAGRGIVIGPDETTTYASDENTLVGLIETPRSDEQAEGGLAMPNPESELYRAPEGAAEVADLRGIAGPPVDRYVRSASAEGGEEPSRLPSSEQPGFFSKLFASLIE